MAPRTLDRYEIRSVLGRGATGIVYEAYDPQTRSVVALKTLSADSADNLYRLKHEFRALYDVQHPNLVRLGELGSDAGQWYLTMEIVRGVTFIEHVRPGARLLSVGVDGSQIVPLQIESGAVPVRPGSALLETAGELDEARLRAAIPQLVLALAAIHEKGHVHRDVKPSNVLVAEDGRVVLLDFGLVAARAWSERAGDAGLEGTPAFMAPEQIEGRHVGPPADWYSVGVMLYVALTGRLPFEGSLHEILDRKLTREAPSPADIVPDVPADLRDLCEALLRMDPSQRPEHDEIARRLGLEPPRGMARESMVPDAAVFVGRRRELGELAHSFERVAHGGTELVVVEGEAGVGKSAVVHQFLASLEGKATVLCGRCYEQETAPFKGVDAILDALSEHLLGLNDAKVRALVAGGVHYLAAVFPVLNRVPAVAAATAGERATGNAAALREQAFDELEALLRALAARRPVVLFVDDLQWADQDSLALLTRTLVGALAVPCLFVSTMRPGAPAEVRRLTSHALHVRLEGLSLDESRALWDALSPFRRAAAVTDVQRDALVREAGGHPLFLTELVRTAGDRAGALTGSERLQDILWRRVSERDEVDRRFLETAAIAGAPTAVDVLAAAAGIDLGECRTRLGPLRAAQLVRVGARGEERMVEPYHDRIREAVLLHVDDESRAARQLALGRALLASAPEAGGVAQRIFAIVHHLDASRARIADPAERAQLIDLNLLAARQARLATAYGSAREYTRIGLELAREGGEDDAWTRHYARTRDLHVERMQADFLAGAFEEARTCFAYASRRITTPEDRIGLYSSWIELLSGEGRYADAIAAGREVLDALAAPVPAKVGTLGVLWRYLSARRVQKGRSTDALVSLPQLRDRRLEGVMKILISLAPPAFFSDTNLLTWILLRIAAISMRAGVTDVSSYGFGGYGLVLSAAFGRREEGEAFSRFALVLNERFKNVALASKLRFIAGMLTPWVLPFDAAKEHLREGYEIGLKIGDTTYECYSAVVLSIVWFCESRDLSAVQERAEWAREVSARRKDRAMVGVPDSHARHAATLRGLTPSAFDLGNASSTDAEFRASLSDEVTPTALFYYQFCSADLAYHFGEASRARALLVEAKRRMQGIFGLPTTVELSFLDALVAAREHDAAGLFERVRLRWAVARELRRLRAWAGSAPANFDVHASIVEAELARIRGERRAGDVFARAAAMARDRGDAKREGLALELWGRWARARGDEATAAARTREAIEAYRRWGALAKVEALGPGRK
ncbi:MAG TPA: AAA family ATPase [Polyangiaceae bacterium]